MVEAGKRWKERKASRLLCRTKSTLFCFPYPVPDVVVETLHTGSGLATILTYPVEEQ
jgi:hypothetical protein